MATTREEIRQKFEHHAQELLQCAARLGGSGSESIDYIERRRLTTAGLLEICGHDPTHYRLHVEIPMAHEPPGPTDRPLAASPARHVCPACGLFAEAGPTTIRHDGFFHLACARKTDET